MDSLVAPAPQPSLTRTTLYAPIARDLGEVERILRNSLDNDRPRVGRLLGELRQYEGKRLRPALLLLTARACGEVTPAHHLLGAVVEMIHTATLVHDDVLDDASVRRHAPTANAAWGNQTSVLLGDYLFTHAFHLASTLGDVRACRIIGEATNRVCEGEMQQSMQRGDIELGEAEYLDIIDGKTAELTACCCRLGALYSGAAPAVIDRLSRYGRSLGMAFQIADDVLDYVATSEEVGKPVGADLRQGTVTLPLMLALKDREAGPRLRAILDKVDLNDADYETVVTLVRNSTAIAEAERSAQEFALEAAAELRGFPPSEALATLERVCGYVVERRI